METLKKKRNILFTTLVLSIAIFTLLTLIIGHSKTLAVISIMIIPVLSFFTIMFHIIFNIEKYYQKMIGDYESWEDTKECNRIEKLSEILFSILWFLSWVIVTTISVTIGVVTYSWIYGKSISSIIS